MGNQGSTFLEVAGHFPAFLGKGPWLEFGEKYAAIKKYAIVRHFEP